MKRAFSLVELMIVIAVLGILAAIVAPTLQGHIAEAKEAAAKDNLRILRNTIELYAARHNGVPPGYGADDPSTTPLVGVLYNQLVQLGKYLSELPENPFNKISVVNMIPNATPFPSGPAETETYGWIYKPAEKKVRLNWPGTDSAGTAYFDY